MTDSEKKLRAQRVVEELEKLYSDALCALEYNREKPYELLISCRLSAQCKDSRVNVVTKELFRKYTSLEDFAEADVADIAAIIKPCGLFNTKAQSIKDMSSELLSRFDGRLPDTIEELVTLSGVGRKSANLILGDIYGKPAIVADTHLIRISNRLGLCEKKDPVDVEKTLKGLIPPEKSSDFCHRVVMFGRDCCSARGPKCSECPLKRNIEGLCCVMS